MKRLFVPLAVLLMAAGFSACYKKTNCTTPLIRKVVFYVNSTAVTISDTGALLVKASKGSMYSQIADTLYSRLDNSKSVYFPDNGADTYDYDWKVVLIPSGYTFKIQKLEHDDVNSNGGPCTSTVSYTVNDTMVTKTGNPYSTTPYEVPEIRIKWYY
jgi:hypothetical protein